MCGSLRLGAEAAVAILEGATATTDSFEVRLGEGPAVRVPSAVTPDLHDVGNWSDGLYMTRICRDSDLLDSLRRVPIEVLRGSSARGLEHGYRFAEALQLYWRKDQRSAEVALSALRATEAQNLPTPTVRSTHMLSRPAMEVLSRLNEKRAEAFNQSLVHAVELHREFWSRDEALGRNPDGYLSSGLRAWRLWPTMPKSRSRWNRTTCRRASPRRLSLGMSVGEHGAGDPLTADQALIAARATAAAEGWPGRNRCRSSVGGPGSSSERHAGRSGPLCASATSRAAAARRRSA